MELIKIVSTQKPNILEIRWCPNNVCNYKCSYCWPGSHEGNFKSPNNLDLVLKNFNHLIEKYKAKLGKTKIRFIIIGGEPTLWKEFGQFIEGIKKEHDVYISVLTNGSRTLRWWKQYGHLIDNAHISCHLAFADIDHLISVADTLYEFNKKVTVKVLMDTRYWQKGLDTIEYMKKNSKYKWFIVTDEVIEPDIILPPQKKKFLKNALQRLPSLSWWWKNKKLIFENQIRLFESKMTFDNGKTRLARVNTYVNEDRMSFKGWSCSIGIDNVFVGPDGRIMGACELPVYGEKDYHNILDENFIEKFDPEFKSIICERDRCNCVTENHVSKHRLS